MGRGENESPAMALTQEQFTALLAAVRAGSSGDQTDRLEQILLRTAEVSAEAMKRSLNPENKEHPGKSVFSYPEGDMAKPRPVMPYELFWNNFPVHLFPETQHWLELEMMARLQPGEYYVSKANDEGAQQISVKGERDANQKLTKVRVEIAGIGRDEMRAAPPTVVWLYQMLNSDRPRGETYIEGTTLFMRHVAMQQPPVAVAV